MTRGRFLYLETDSQTDRQEDVDVPFRSTVVLDCGPAFLNDRYPVINTKKDTWRPGYQARKVAEDDRVGRSSPSPKCNGRNAVQVQSRVRLLPVEHVGCDGSLLPIVPACPCPPQPRAGQNGQVPNTACDSRDMQYSVPRTNLHTSLSTSLIRLVSLVQVRALLQIQIELDPHPISTSTSTSPTSTRLCSTCHRSFRPRFAQVASDLGGFGCDSSLLLLR